MNEDQIRKLFSQHEVSLGRDDVWRVQGTPVIKHSALERLSAALKLTWHAPVLIRHERDECVVLVTASRADGITEWSFGEALVNQDGQAGGNYKVSGKQASYVYAMGEKRGKDRVIIKLAGLHGAYSEEEADDFKDRSKRDADTNSDRRVDIPDIPMKSEVKVAAERVLDQNAPSSTAHPLGQDGRSPDDLLADAKVKIDGFAIAGQVTLFMTNKSVKKQLANLGEDRLKDLREHARKRYEALKATSDA